MATAPFDAVDFLDAKLADLREQIARAQRLTRLLAAAKAALARPD